MSPAQSKVAPARTGGRAERALRPGRRGGEEPAEAPTAFLSRGRRWVPAIAALLTAAAGVINVLSALTPEWRSRLSELSKAVPGALSRSAAAATVVAGVLLLMLARALRRRKRRAWRAVVVLLAASVLLHVTKGLDYEEAVVSFLLLVALVLTRGEFCAKGDPSTRWRAVWVGLGLTATSVVVGLVLLHLRERRLVGSHPLSAEVRHILLGMVGVVGPLTFVSDRFEDLVAKILFALGLFTVLTTAYLALRPPRRRPRLSEDDEKRMRALLDRYGDRDSLGYFALRPDKSVIWSPTGKSCIAYRVVSGVMLASGDPLGDNEAWPGAIKEFLREAADHAWTPAVIGCSETGGIAWARAGLSALEFGDEAVVEVSEFSLEGRPMRNVRQAVARVERAGYTCRVRRVRDIPPAEQQDLRRQAAAWRDTQTERGFSMALGRFGDPADGECVAVTAFQDTGTGPALRAFLHFVPWGGDGLSLDLMRRDKTADNGLNEFLIVSALRAAPELGVKRLSLNFAFFRSAIERGERLGAGPVIRAWRGLLVFLSRWFQIDSLYRFNAKFRPRWEPRYVCYPTVRDLPRIAVAMLEAEAFLVRPRLRRPLRPAAPCTPAEAR